MSCTAGNHCALNKSFNLKRNCIHSFWIQGKLHFTFLLVPVKFSLLLTHLLQLIGVGRISLISQSWSVWKLSVISCNKTTPAGFSTWEASGQLKSSVFTTKHSEKRSPGMSCWVLSELWCFLASFGWNLHNVVTCCWSQIWRHSWCFFPAVCFLSLLYIISLSKFYVTDNQW